MRQKIRSGNIRVREAIIWFPPFPVGASSSGSGDLADIVLRCWYQVSADVHATFVASVLAMV